MRSRLAALAAFSLMLVSLCWAPPVLADPKDPPPPPKKDTPPPKELPPPPERKPEEPVEYPKDEPPIEDPRIEEDAKDDHNEDPNDKPNRDLGETGKTDPPGVGLGGGAGGRGAKGPFESRLARSGSVKFDRVKAALEWLKDHQNVEGFWSSNGFSDDTKRVNARKSFNLEFDESGAPKGDIGWEQTPDIGLSGLSLLAFAGAGYDHKQGDYKETCRRTLMYLRKVQGNDGCFGPKDDEHFNYAHAICTNALCEIYGMTGDQLLKGPCENAVKFILAAQNPGLGWRYGIKPGDNDTSVTGWMISALKSAKLAGIEADYKKSFTDAAKWLDSVTTEYQGYPKTGYDTPAGNNARLRAAQEYENNPCMDAINVYSRLVMQQDGKDNKSRDLQPPSRACLEFLPTWDHHKIDYYYWYYASLALYQMGDNYWPKWEKALGKTLMDNQRGFRPEDKGSTKDTLDEHGSWDSVDAWGEAGGRVYSTAINCLTLEVTNRYARIADLKKPVAVVKETPKETPKDPPKEAPKETPKDDPWEPK